MQTFHKLNQMVLALLISLGLTAHVMASSSSSTSTEVGRFTPAQIVSFAKKVEKTIALKGAQVAILARMGRPLAELPEGMHFTHVAFAVYSEIDTANGEKVPGYVIYNLYQRNKQPDVSELVQDFPVDFFFGGCRVRSGHYYSFG